MVHPWSGWADDVSLLTHCVANDSVNFCLYDCLWDLREPAMRLKKNMVVKLNIREWFWAYGNLM